MYFSIKKTIFHSITNYPISTSNIKFNEYYNNIYLLLVYFFILTFIYLLLTIYILTFKNKKTAIHNKYFFKNISTFIFILLSI